MKVAIVALGLLFGLGTEAIHAGADQCTDLALKYVQARASMKDHELAGLKKCVDDTLDSKLVREKASSKTGQPSLMLGPTKPPAVHKAPDATKTEFDLKGRVTDGRTH